MKNQSLNTLSKCLLNTDAMTFILTVNYKSKILKAYFEEINPEYTIKFIEEEKPLGTAGSLKYLSGMFESPFFVTNCDIIVKSNYHSLYKFHKEGEL